MFKKFNRLYFCNSSAAKTLLGWISKKSTTTTFSLSWNPLPQNAVLGLYYGYYGGPVPWGSGFCLDGHCP